MKIIVPVVGSKVVEAPDFLRPYIVGEKNWDEMSYEEDRLYMEWYEELDQRETLIDDMEWYLAEGE